MLETAAISLTDRCNLDCGHCGGSHIYSCCAPERSEISRGALRNLFSQLRGLGLATIILSGGEPLLRRDLPAIIDDAENAAVRFNAAAAVRRNGQRADGGRVGWFV